MFMIDFSFGVIPDRKACRACAEEKVQKKRKACRLSACGMMRSASRVIVPEGDAYTRCAYNSCANKSKKQPVKNGYNKKQASALPCLYRNKKENHAACSYENLINHIKHI
ncbi:MAG: hypothetical protein EOM63_00540 [Clostridia bacterium]|nr:hypothetical protein [Clostridia bacterium]